jgi:predicted nucleic acid-binding protein
VIYKKSEVRRTPNAETQTPNPEPYWDAAIIEAARSLACSELWTEDLQDQQDFGGISAVNPFRAGGG